MPSTRPILLALAAIASAAVAGCTRENVFQEPPPPTVTVASPAVEEITTYTEFPGRLEASTRADIRARVAGFLRSVEFKPGEVVDEGALLFTIEPEPFEADLAVAKAAEAEADAALKLARETLRRIEAAASRDAASQFEVLESSAKVDQAEAMLQAAGASVRSAQISLDYTRILAPFAGRLSEQYVDVGNLVGAGESTLLTTIVADDIVHAYFTANERQLLRFLDERPAPDRRDGPNRPAFLRLLDGTDYPHEGVVDFANNELDPATGAIRIRAVFTNPEARLYPGLFVRVRIPDRTAQRVLIPETAIQRDQVGPFVLTVDDAGTVARRDIVLGALADRTRRIVTEGLDETDRIVTVGLQRARPGGRVNAQQAQAPHVEGAG